MFFTQNNKIYIYSFIYKNIFWITHTLCFLVPILVAINKIDSPKADVERTEKMLVDIGIQTEKLGGDVQAVPISALKKQNLDQLTDALLLQAELCEIKGDPTGPVEAVVVESKASQYRGKLCTVVVQRGKI